MSIHNCRRPSGYIMYNRIKDSHRYCGGGNNYGSIYNIEYNCSGSHGGGFWSGVGAALGCRLGGMLSNFLGFGNFRCFGMGGFGFGGFGMGGFAMPFMSPGWNNGFGNFWGGGSSSKKTSSSVTPYSTTTATSVTTSPGNADTQKLKELTDKFNSLVKTKSTPEHDTQQFNTDIQALLDELKNLIENPIDDAEDDADIDLYEDLQKRVENLKNGKITVNDTSTPINLDTPIKIDNKEIKTLDDLNSIPPNDFKTQINSMTPETAQILLIKLGYITYDATSPQYKNTPTPDGTCSYLCGKMSKHPNVLMLLEKANIAVEVYKGNGGKSDNWVTGRLSNIIFDESGKLTSFNVNCTNDGGKTFQGAYTFTVSPSSDASMKFKVTITSDNKTTQIASGEDSVELKEDKKACSGNLQISSC